MRYKNHVSGFSVNQSLFQKIMVISGGHGAFSKVPYVSRLFVPGIYKKISCIAFNDINGGFSAIGIGHEFIRQAVQINNAV